jgi:hypothetical protein
MQKRATNIFEPVFSSNFHLACRSESTGQKHSIPDIDFTHSDDLNLARQRSKLAEDQITLVKDVNPLDVYARPPNQDEFNLI